MNATRLYIFGRFHVGEGSEQAALAALRDVIGPTREEPGCLEIHQYRSVRDPRRFYVHSTWSDEVAFELHAGLPHTVRFIERMEALVDQPIEVTRCERLE